MFDELPDVQIIVFTKINVLLNPFYSSHIDSLRNSALVTFGEKGYLRDHFHVEMILIPNAWQ